MKQNRKGCPFNQWFAVWFLMFGAEVFVSSPSFADTLNLASGGTITGTVLQTNDVCVLVLTEFGTLSYPSSLVKGVRVDRAEAPESSDTNRIPGFKKTVLALAKQPWATNLRQIPATVIDNGVLRAVPYKSFRCGEDYEVNIYGDPDVPAGIEVGVYRTLVDDAAAKDNCITFISSLLDRATDKEIVHHLNRTKDLKSSDGLTVEITPPSAPDAYGGWWFSVYSEQGLNLARASDDELKQISIPKRDVAKGIAQNQDPAGWAADDLRFARFSETTLTFRTKSGLMVTNAQIKPYVEGVSLLWRDGNGGGGIVKLVDLPEELQRRFGYDPAKALAADSAERDKRARDLQWQAQANAAAADAQLAQARVRAAQASENAGWNFDSFGSSAGGSVYVRGYTRRDGTYVQGYNRRR